MPTHRQIKSSSLQRERHWRPGVHRLAAAAAAAGEPTPLLVLGSHELRERAAEHQGDPTRRHQAQP
jgi:hypothetical protein